jgi:hypothetical protein
MTGLSENHRFFWWQLVQGITRLEEDLFYLKIFNLMFQVQHKEHMKITQHMAQKPQNASSINITNHHQVDHNI